MNTRQIEFAVSAADGSVSGLLERPADARRLLVLGHGAGAGMRHPFMAGISERLAAEGIASLRYQFPYMEAGRRRPDRREVLVATVRAAVEVGGERGAGATVVGGRKIDGWADDLARGCGSGASWRAGLGVLRLSAASGRAAVDRAGGASRCGAAADAVFGG